MKSIIVGMLAGAGAIIGSSLLSTAQNAPPPRPQIEVRRPEEAADQSFTFRAKDVLGMTVRDVENQAVGTVEDLVIDGRNGQVLYAVMAYASLQNRDQLVITPWRALQVHTGPRAPDRFVVLHVEPQRLLKGPIVTRNQWPQVIYSEWPSWQTRIDTYYEDFGGVKTKTRIKERNGKFEQKSETEFRDNGVKDKEKIEVERDGDIKIKKKVERDD